MSDLESLVRRLKTARDAHHLNAVKAPPGGTVTLSAYDLKAHGELLQEVINLMDVKPAAYSYSLARARFLDGSGYCEWGPPQIGFTEPCVPEGSMRGLTRLWALDGSA